MHPFAIQPSRHLHLRRDQRGDFDSRSRTDSSTAADLVGQTFAEDSDQGAKDQGDWGIAFLLD